MKYQFSEYQLAWLAALRSGTYQQGQNFLAYQRNEHLPIQYCCLGVACEINPSVKRILLPTYGPDDLAKSMRYNGAEVVLPNETYLELKLNSVGGKFSKGFRADYGNYGSLVEMNDRCVTFNQIADFIEQHPELVFSDAND